MGRGVKVKCVLEASALLGEGPVWDAPRGLLWWIDIRRGRLHRHDPATDASGCVDLPHRITAVAPAQDGRLVACGDTGFVYLDPDTLAIEPIVRPEGEPAGNRFNDAKVDRHGRLWAGTMDDAEEQASGAVHRLGRDGAVRRVGKGFRVPNGPAFDSTGRMFIADSPTGHIYVHANDGDGPRAIFASFGGAMGYPDGMTCDAEDHLWVAFWGGWCVRRIAPDGKVVAEVAMPVAQPTSVAFGGDALATLFVTSASTGLDADALTGQPLAGGLFAMRPNVGGTPAPIFGAPQA